MKKKGFTLIELLAVIVILAVIALIATPAVLNIIEESKVRAIENSCYGIIRSVKTKYTSDLLSNINGSTNRTGNVSDVEVDGEKPTSGTWTIDRKGDDVEVKIKDVKFDSLKDYTCTNVKDDGTVSDKVSCTKGGSDSDATPTGYDGDEALYTAKILVDFDINYEKCMEWYGNDERYDSECKGETSEFDNNVWEYTGEFDDLMSDGIIENPVYIEKELSCFAHPVVATYDLDKDKCISMLTDSYNTTEIATKICNGEEVNGQNLDTIMHWMPTLFTRAKIISNYKEVSVDKTKIIGYRCGENNFYNMPYISDVVIPEKTVDIGTDKYQDIFYELGLTSVDFSKAKNLETIGSSEFTGNDFVEIELSDLPKLKSIGNYAFSNNQIKNVKLENLPSLTSLDGFDKNEISSIDLSNLTNLTSLSGFRNNQITSIDLSNLVNLKSLSGFGGNQITNIDLSKLINLESLDGFYDNQITSIDLSNLVNLKSLSGFNDNQITSIDLSKQSNLTLLSGFGNNLITSVDFSNLTKLTELGDYYSGAFNNNQITSLDLSNLVNLKILSGFSSNSLSTLKLGNMPNLTYLNGFNHNELSGTLDLTSMPNLQRIGSWDTLSDTKLKVVKLPNSVKYIDSYAFRNNSYLTLIEIDNTEGAISGAPWGASNATIKYLR